MPDNKTRFVGDGELVTEIRKRLIKINDYIQHPTEEYFADLMDLDLIQTYGRERIKEVVRDAFANQCNACVDARGDLYRSYGVPYLSYKFTVFFNRFNQDYFDGKLPQFKVNVLNHMDNHFQTAEILRDQKVIRILAASEGNMVMRLLAEMARIASSDDGYGEAWEAEMTRLDRAGAPVVVYPDRVAPNGNFLGLNGEEFINFASRRWITLYADEKIEGAPTIQ